MMNQNTAHLSVQEFISKLIAEEPCDDVTTHMLYPTAISKTLGFRIIAAGPRTATIAFTADTERFGNQQGTLHGGTLCELADAAFGTAHSTIIEEGETFTSLELKINFFRPVWNGELFATASPVHAGRTVSCYVCEISDENNRLIAQASSTIMTLRGEQAKGR